MGADRDGGGEPVTNKAAEMIMRSGADAIRLFGYGDRSDCRSLAHGAIALRARLQPT